MAVRYEQGTPIDHPTHPRKSRIRSIALPSPTEPGAPFEALGPASPTTHSQRTLKAFELLEGTQSLSKFGHSVSEAGDVNGDGYDDIIVGAPGSGRDQSGSVLVFFGGSEGIGKIPGWSYHSPITEAEFGHQVSGAGDVNGDGFADLLVGATYHSATGLPERTGAAFLFLGGTHGPSAQPDWQVFGTATGDNTGFAVGAAGDVNGDGYDDVLIGSWNAEINALVKGRRAGSASLFLGGPSGLSERAVWQPEGEKRASHYGYSLHGLGDVNGDGFGDIVIGAWGFETERSNAGRVYVYLGGSGGPSRVPAWVLTGVHDHQQIGASVFPAGDVNGDGYADLLVGATGSASPEIPGGQALLFLGGPDGLSTQANWTFEPKLENWAMGHSVATAGDLNGDGVSDIVVSSMVGQVRHPKEGMAFVFLGSKAGPSRSPNWIFAGREPQGGYGSTVRPAGDVNQDGYDDLLVGQTYHTGSLFQQGAAWVHYGGPGGLLQGIDWRQGIEQLGFQYRNLIVPLPTFLGRILIAAVFALVLLSASLLIRHRSVRRQGSLINARKEAQSVERARLSEDLHDHFGSELTDLLITGSLIRRHLGSGQNPEAPLARMEMVSRRLVESLGEIVWLTQPNNDRLERLAGYLGDLAQKTLEPAEIRCQLDIPVSLPDLEISYHCRHDVVLAVREALTNCIRHANTPQVVLRIRIEGTNLRLDIEDSGTGISKERSKSGGHGLQNMATRLHRHGGIADIQSGPSGTRVCLQLPLPKPPHKNPSRR